MFLIVAAFALASNYNIIQRGNDIISDHGLFGNYVSLAGAGTVLAVSEDTTLRVLKYSNGNWTGIQNFTVDNAFDSISISENGSVIAVGNPKHNHVWTFTETSSGWETNSQTILIGSGCSTDPSSSVSVSADGLRIAVGGPKCSNFNGIAKVWSRENGNWAFRDWKDKIDGHNYERLGHSTSLSGNGTRLAVSSPHFDQYKGKVQLYQINQSKYWLPLGDAIEGETANDFFWYNGGAFK